VALATFLQILRPQTLHEQRAKRLYHAQVQHMADRVRAIFDTWGTLREVQPDNARLANAAAVNRWELMRMAREVEQLEPPRSLANVHRDVHNAMLGCARACQLLANGYRFHKSEAVCDGQALMVETLGDIADLLGQIRTR